jgi:hypothetical protein
VRRTLSDAASRVAARCGGAAAGAPGGPPLFSYSHYPLGLIASSPGAGRAGGGGRELARALAAARVAGHVSGHLHSLAGPFM